jgi:hypothetical protein
MAAGVLVAHLSHQEDRHQRRHEADARFGIADAGIAIHHGQVTGGDESRTACHRRSVDRGDDRLGEGRELQQQLGQVTRVGEVLFGAAFVHPLQLAQVESGAEGVAGPGEHHRACVPVVGRHAKRISQGRP